MRILIAHNYYQQPGGEDVVFDDESRLLESRGHTVFRYTVRNDRIELMGRLKAAATTLWNGAARREIADVIREHGIDVAHFHNTFPLISPAAYGGARKAGAAVVKTLHNHRLACVNAVLCRDDHACQDCVGKPVAWRGVMHGCYRGSRSASAVVAMMQVAHRAAGTWSRNVDAFIAPSASTRRILCESGLPAERVIVKPHFVAPDPKAGDGSGGYAVFVGRLAEGKGLGTLLRAWELLGPRCPTLKVIGDGPLASLVRSAPARVEWLGRLPMQQTYDVIGGASVLIFPSEGLETFGRVIAEAYAKGTPVIASRQGPSPEMVEPGVTGYLFEPGDAADLAAKVTAVYSDPQHLQSMRAAARAQFEEKYHADANYDQLLAIYDRALARRRGNRAQRPAVLRHDELGRWAPAGLADR